MTIPTIIHQIWLQGLTNLPVSLQKCHQSCIEINHQFKHLFWDETRIVHFLQQHYSNKTVQMFYHYSIPAQRADFARYLILYVYGGIYLDMDMICKKSLIDFVHLQFFFTHYPLADYVQKYLNGIIGAKPKHPAFMIMLKNMIIRLPRANDILYSTGTALFYHSIQEYKKKYPNDITIVDRQYLDPCNLFNGPECIDNCTDCYIVHTHYSSWSKTNKCIKLFFQYRCFYLVFILLIALLFYYKVTRK